ncbi:unnamed protein product [Mytilus coruscus]|uniref:RING-type domain-containing protein n=1 Tax=Mytilus coruscus TaxID=42192 RepID=A0A6J7ZUR3_MYTCO|nr:unnamed protein product [Mytilus coruscus]
MSDVQPLIGLLEVLLQLSCPKPRVKPGGYSDDIFLDLTEEEKEAYECSICYQVLKEPQKCRNNHQYCYSCIYTWTTSSPEANHGRCPVCRVDGPYRKHNELDEIIGKKKVKCNLKSCNWKGTLKSLGGHRHTTYTRTGLPYRPTNRVRVDEDLPAIPNTDRRTPSVSDTPRSVANARASSVARRHNTSSSRNSIIESSPFTPRPPSSSRPQGQGQGQRRIPTLPSIVNQNSDRRITQGRTTAARRNTGTNTQNGSFQGGNINIRDRLRDSRNRLDAMMTSFASELDRGRRDIADFQQERERRRQEQLQEVRDLGRRLGHVAQELRGLLERRQQMSSGDSSSSDDDNF